MLSTVHKADILRKAGYDLPTIPASLDTHDMLPVIDALYADYVTARAARSLREAEEARRASAMRGAQA
ncbi:hypothetical protein [Variovorax paradoxus]|jgi:hypothetical protein|uniref:Uncharacterized protein n=1 Tax=Variovorax paradoxus TaxID=34073 RepID=A0A679JHD6_VARPD|nr:hypothetical protein VVAX_04886 [Variovorax paradoxus]